jgi:hypothetical protein
MSNITHIPIIFDKSHLLTIGERLYSTSLDLVRELVSNAYDADATVVKLEIRPEEIVVADNGSGMDIETLKQYFIIGSQEKRLHAVSPVYQRKRIGEFGIGKFSVLTVSDYFVVETQQRKKQFHARLVFDAEKWRNDSENWSVPCEVLPYDADSPEGTTITLQKLKKPLDSSNVIRHIRERLPIGRKDFQIFVNGNEVTATAIPGKRFPVHFDTPFGPIDGEIVLANIPVTQRNIADAGITIQVKNISVTKSLFGFEVSHSVGVSRLRGFVNADFLPITSSRDNVIQDSEEYKVLYEKTREYLKAVLREARNLAFQKENARASEILRDALDKIGRAFKKNPEAFQESFVAPPLGEAPFSGFGEEGYSISKAQFVDGGIPPPALLAAYNQDIPTPADKPMRRRHMSLANRAIIRKMKFRNLGIICRMERYGAHYPPSFFEQGIIYLNIDHPLYRKQMEHDALLTMFIATLIGKELAVQKHPHDASAAYAFQHQLLTDAFKDVRAL